MGEWIDTKDQAKLIRAALKKNFPGTKFGVRISRYSGGSNVFVEWTDGPRAKDVVAITDSFDGRRFDGMQDLAYAAEHFLMPDGSSVYAREVGHNVHNDSLGLLEMAELIAKGGRPVRYSGSVSTSRDLSPEFRSSLLGELAQAAAVPVENLLTPDGNPDPVVRLPLAIGREHDQELAGQILRMGDTRNSVDNLLWQLASFRASA